MVKPRFQKASVPPRHCNFVAGENSQACGKFATIHLLWGNRGRSAFCGEHGKLVLKNCEYEQYHDLGPDCGMPGAKWIKPKNVCRVPGWEEESEEEVGQEGVRETAGGLLQTAR